ncbi:MAG: carbohydrate ABC transporter permease [Clostridiales bacterium]|nr:carbohydrate ABC transporter permease [Clostridiales bacterium]MDD6871310.1 carbohydrate ABC transporter permease [Clostridiales bacterium]
MSKQDNKFNVIGRGWNALFTTILCIVSLTMIIPMALVVVVSFSSELSIANKGFSFFPETWTLEGYRYLAKMGDQVLRSYGITIFYTVTGTLMSLTVMSLYAYVLAQRSFRHHKFMTWILFFTMLFGGGLVPSYILNVRYLHIYDTIWVFLLPSLVSAYNVIILRTFIQTTIPESLFEAARIDGANHFQVFGKIVLPLYKAGLATIGLFNVVGRWNDWFTGVLYIENPNLVPLQTLLQKIQSSIEFIKQNAAVAGTPDGIELMRNLPQQNLRMACMIIIILPVLAAYPFFQRYFVSGLTIGSVKE